LYYACCPQEEQAGPVLELSRLKLGEVLRRLQVEDAQSFRGVEVSMLSDDLDSDPRPAQNSNIWIFLGAFTYIHVYICMV